MKRAAAIALVIIGVMALALGYINGSWNEKVVKMGPVHIAARTRERSYFTYVGVGALAGAAVLLLLDSTSPKQRD